MAIEKTLKVFARIGFSDVIVPVDQEESNVVGTDTFLVGYEDENGRECERGGTYLTQNHKP
tara:strand:+ start:38590 stop:38772 length:183 start_codon:yes stop_codon:yes gene_type:complete